MVVTAIEILEQGGVLRKAQLKKLQHWLSDFVDWLMTSEIGMAEGARPNNHGSWYDYQVIGLLTFLGRRDEARTHAQAVKDRRIKSQITATGAQPEELKRTKSLSYSTMNLQGLVLVAMMGDRLNVDLLHFASEEGSSLLGAASFLAPIASGKATWSHQQIGAGGWQAIRDSRLLSLFSVMSSIYGRPLIAEIEKMTSALPELRRLQFPPLMYIKD